MVWCCVAAADRDAGMHVALDWLPGLGLGLALACAAALSRALSRLTNPRSRMYVLSCVDLSRLVLSCLVSGKIGGPRVQARPQLACNPAG